MSFDDPSTAEAGPASVLREEPRITFTIGGRAVTRAIALGSPPIVVGSSASAHVVLADRSVSRLHAELEARADGLWLRDIGSRNGSFVAGIRVVHARVPAGATVQLGNVTATVDYERVVPHDEIWAEPSFGPMIGGTHAMRTLFATLARAAASEATILVEAETGSGKELVARAVHDASPRKDAPFVVVDCAALPDNLLESELFGHVRGAFTGAVANRIGAFEAAAGGTLFLDEIGELPLAMQPKLLRVLESRTIRRIGETAQRTIDVRIVAATHRDLRSMAAAGSFREDLYFRLAVLPVHLPPLRERPGDIPVLLDRFLQQPAVQVLGHERLARIVKHPWVGNVRELRNFADRVRALGADRAVAMVMGELDEPISGGASVAPAAPTPTTESLHDFREEWIAHAERTYLAKLLADHGANLTQAAKVAGISRAHIYRLIQKYRL